MLCSSNNENKAIFEVFTVSVCVEAPGRPVYPHTVVQFHFCILAQFCLDSDRVNLCEGAEQRKFAMSAWIDIGSQGGLRPVLCSSPILRKIIPKITISYSTIIILHNHLSSHYKVNTTSG